MSRKIRHIRLLLRSLLFSLPLLITTRWTRTRTRITRTRWTRGTLQTLICVENMKHRGVENASRRGPWASLYRPRWSRGQGTTTSSICVSILCAPLDQTNLNQRRDALLQCQGNVGGRLQKAAAKNPRGHRPVPGWGQSAPPSLIYGSHSFGWLLDPSWACDDIFRCG
jgi:hypothetical protein